MKIYSISDLHLDVNNSKPMDIFGPVWHDYLDKIIDDWNSKVSENDVVILAGDLSWAMKLSGSAMARYSSSPFVRTGTTVNFFARFFGTTLVISAGMSYVVRPW